MAKDRPLTDLEYARLTGKDPDLRVKDEPMMPQKPNFFDAIKKIAGSGLSIVEMLQGAKTAARASDMETAKNALNKIKKA